MRRLLPVIAIAAWILVAGCGGNVSVKAERNADTGILPGEQIAVLLLSYSLQGNQVKDISSIEEGFVGCIRTEMQGVKNDLTFLPRAALRKLVSNDTTDALTAFLAYGLSPQSREWLLGMLAEPVIATRLAQAKVRYIVLLEASYSSGPSEVQGSNAGGVVGWRQYSDLKATILDLRHGRLAGSIESISRGSEGGVLNLVIPFYFSELAESGACVALGEELGRFILGTSTP